MKPKFKEARLSIPGLSADSEGAPEGAFVLSIEGLDATGKSRLALEASIAGPMAYYSTDGGVQRAGLKDFREMGREIHVGSFEYSVPKFIPRKAGGPEGEWWVQKSKELMRDVYAPYLSSLEAAIDSSQVRVIVLDTATEFWDLAQLANFGRLQQNNSLMYGPVHTEFKGPIRRARAMGKIVILIHHLKDVYKDEADSQGQTRSIKQEGKFTRQGNAKIHYLCDAMVRTHYIEGTRKKVGNEWKETPARWEIEMLKPKMNMDLLGQRLEVPDFPTLMSLLHPTADPSCWEA